MAFTVLLWAGLPPRETLGKCGKCKIVVHLFAQVVQVNIYLSIEQRQRAMKISSTYETASHVELTVRRPNGTVETVVFPHRNQINDTVFAQIVKSTKDAGRGEVMSYTNVTKTMTIDPKDLAEMQAMSDAEERYNNGNRAVYAAMDAYHEGHRDGNDNDNTPSHKNDN